MKRVPVLLWLCNHSLAGIFFENSRSHDRRERNVFRINTDITFRRRQLKRYLSQPFFVAEQFTGMEGKYVPISETIRGFKEILEGTRPT